jgi:uncharacterized protein YbjT (DUF2867 family)
MTGTRVSEPRRPSGQSASVGATLLGGPIAITGASGQEGSALDRRLSALRTEVRTVARGDDPATAFRDAAAVVHLGGTLRPERPSTYEEANVGTVRRTVAALAGSSVERVVFLSYVGADRHAENAYLRAKGEAEELLYRSGRDCVVFRCTHIFGPPDDPGPTVSALLAGRGRSVWLLGDGNQRVAPVYREDVVDAIIAALDPRTYHGRFDLPGPEELTMDDFAQIVNADGVRLRHVPPRVARALSRAAPGLTPELVDVMLADSLGEQQRAERTFGLVRHEVSEVYRLRSALAA